MTVSASRPPVRPVASSLVAFDAVRTASLLDFHDLVDELARVANEYEAGRIASPERMVVPMGQGGVLLSMPATASDIGIHKLVNVHPANAELGLPTIHGLVTVCDARTGEPKCLLDGPEVTGRRTAAISLLAIRALLREAPRDVLLIGTGTQARYHLQALRALHPSARIRVRSRSVEAAEAFCAAAACELVLPCPDEIPATVDVVITLTTALEPVYNEVPSAGRLVIGVGAFKPEMAELGSTTLDTSDLYADDLEGVRHEAGDLMRAGVDWSRIRSLAQALRGPVDPGRPAVFKSVGTAAWDLAAARVALKTLAARG